MRRRGHLFDRITAYGHLLSAANRARRGKRNRTHVAAFVFDLERNLLALQDELRSGTYRMRPYRTFTIHEPKERRICAADFRDRVVQHAVCEVLDPIFEPSLISDTYACRRAKGTHAAVRRVQHFVRRQPYALLCDVRRYFDSIDHLVLKRLLRRKLKDNALLALLDHIIEHPIPGAAHGKGVPIGNLTSQYFANLYLGELDHYLKDRLRVPGYVRYMDDMVIFAGDKVRLHATLAKIEGFLSQALELELRQERTRLAPVSQGVAFLGFRVFPAVVRMDGRKWARARRRIQRRESARDSGSITDEALARSVGSMVSHLAHVDSMGARRRAFTPSGGLG